MDCVIPGPNMKAMTKAIHALSKIGDELYLQGKSDKLLLFTLNLNKTTYVTFTFQDSFFSSYSLKSPDECTCKLLTKSVTGIFKGNKEKKVELCRITLDKDTNLTVKMKYKHDVTITHDVRLLDMEKLSLNVPKNIGVNQIASPSACFAQILNMFQSNDEDVSLDISKAKTVARNYENSCSAISSKHIRTQIAFNSSEFNTYKIQQETHLMMSLKPLRAAVQFAEIFNVPITVSFQVGGRPLILGLKSPTFEADFVISTTTVDGSTQSTAMTTMMTFSAFKNQDKNGKDSEDLNEKDKTALETVNWDHDEFNSEKSVEKRLFNGNSEKQSKNSKKRSSENEGLVVPRSPESPKTKRARLILKRCFDPTFNTQMLDLGEELAANSDVDSDAET